MWQSNISLSLSTVSQRRNHECLEEWIIHREVLSISYEIWEERKGTQPQSLQEMEERKGNLHPFKRQTREKRPCKLLTSLADIRANEKGRCIYLYPLFARYKPDLFKVNTVILLLTYHSTFKNSLSLAVGKNKINLVIHFFSQSKKGNVNFFSRSFLCDHKGSGLNFCRKSIITISLL